MNATNATDMCTGDWPMFSPLPAPLALRDKSLPYHSVGPISNFSAAMAGCCRGQVDFYDAGQAPLGCYYYCMFDVNSSQDEWAQIRDCIVQRGFEATDRLRKERNITGSWFSADGRSPAQVSAASGSLLQAPKLSIWGSLMLGLAFAGGVAGFV
ncbi:hypothetical protein SVAN01_10884 [Stagonosporopsis vannaccii]|nr:hypothetical protein SVAN01_10884 [Stagonosporopsis vannaccii]